MRIGAVVVASGRGFFRYVGGVRFPKVIEEIGGEPMVCRVVRAVAEAEIDSVSVVVNPVFGFRIERALKASCFSCRYVVQPRRRGAAEALMRAMPLLRKEGITDFLAVYADMPLWTTGTIAALVDLHRREQPLLSMATVTLNGEHPYELERYGRVIRIRDATDIRYIVEPANATPEELAARTVNPSLWIWEREWFTTHASRVPPVHKDDGFEPEQYVPPLVGVAVAQGRRVVELPLHDPLETLGVNTAQELELVRGILKPSLI